MEAGPTRPGLTGFAAAVWILRLAEAWSGSRDAGLGHLTTGCSTGIPYSVEVNADDLERLGRFLALALPLGDRRSSLSGDPVARRFPEMRAKRVETAPEAVEEASAGRRPIPA